MSKVIDLKSNMLEKKCLLNNVRWTHEFSGAVNNDSVNRQKKRRMINFFIRKSPVKMLSNIVKSGYSYEDAVGGMFSRRFGNLFILYKFENISGKIKVVLLKLIQLITKHLHAIALRFSKIAEGGEIMHFKLFEVYACEPSLCVNPIER